MEREQIAAIQSLVASAVPELKMEQVSIIDQNGTLLARGGDSDGDQATLKAEEMRMKQEQRLIQTIEDLVGRTVGYGKVRASVTAELNFDRTTTEEEMYNPEQQVARSTQTVEEGASERDADTQKNVSVENNLPGVGGDTLGDQSPTSTSNRTEETTNYEISKTVRNTVREGGDIRRLSVAVLVDGTYKTDKDGNKTYEPRSDAELDKISALVRSAIGLDSQRGDTLEVVNMQFAEIDTSEDLPDNTLFGFDKNKLLDVAEVITVAVMIVLVILLVLQPMVARLIASESTGLDDETEQDLIAARPHAPALEGPAQEFEPANLEEEESSMIDVQKVEGKVKASSVKKVEDIVDAYPTETVSVIRSWMTQD
jgi:flagellar M-ring protein FliF